MKVIAWKIWYTYGRVFDSRKDKWEELPDDGVLVLMLYRDEKDGQGRPVREIATGYDWYFHDGKNLYAYNFDRLEKNKKRYPECSFKQGIWETNEEFEKVRNLAMEDFNI